MVVIGFTNELGLQQVKKSIKQLRLTYSTNITYFIVDYDKCPETRDSYNVTTVPTIVYYKDKVELYSLTSLNETQMVVYINKF